MVDVSGNDHAATGHFGAHQFRLQALAFRHVVHLARYHAFAGVVDLGADGIVSSGGYPFTAIHSPIIGCECWRCYAGVCGRAAEI